MDAQKFNRLLEKIKYDKDAVEAIYREYYLKVKAHVSYHFGKMVEVEDVAHDIFLKLFTIDVPDYVEFPTTWMYRFADHYIIDLMRKKHIQEVELNEAIRYGFDLENTILNEDVKRAMRNLDVVSQQILYMHYWEGYLFLEIADLLNMSHSNVRAKACRAYQTLKIYL